VAQAPSKVAMHVRVSAKLVILIDIIKVLRI